MVQYWLLAPFVGWSCVSRTKTSLDASKICCKRWIWWCEVQFIEKFTPFAYRSQYDTQAMPKTCAKTQYTQKQVQWPMRVDEETAKSG
jgi:hypothetical protein